MECRDGLKLPAGRADNLWGSNGQSVLIRVLDLSLLCICNRVFRDTPLLNERMVR